MKYSLPCEKCDAHLAVEPKDAGRELPCPSCQSLQKLPSMNTIRQLPPVEGTAADKKATKKWSMLQGASFGLGLVLVIVSVIGLVVYYPHYTKAKGEYDTLIQANNGVLPDYTDIEPVAKVMNNMNVGQLWGQWREAQKIQLEEWAPAVPLTIVNNMESTQAAMINFVIVGAVGILALIVAMFLP